MGAKNDIFHDMSQGYGRIRMKLGGQIGCMTRKNWLDFGEDLVADPAYQWDNKKQIRRINVPR